MRAAMTCGVLVLDRALEDVRDGLEAAMRMVGRADRLARAVLDGTELVEQQERIDEMGRPPSGAAGEPRSRHLPAACGP